MTRILCTALAASIVLLATAGRVTSQNAGSGLPARLDRYVTDSVKLTAEERARLVAGQAVTKLLPVSDESKEVAVFGAIWINAPIRRYVDAVKDIERFERGGGFRVTKRISAPPKIEDFAELRLPEEDVDDLRTCRTGDCEVKLSQQSLDRFRTGIDWTSPGARAAADAMMRRIALEYVNGYLAGGNEQLAVYRDKARPTFVAREFREMIEHVPELTTYIPDVRRYLLEYPKVTLPGSSSFLYWQDTRFGLKSTIRISHLTIRESPDDTVVASKMLYASHYFWTGLELRVLLPDHSRGQGFWFAMVNRSRSDGLSGFTGFFARRRVRSGTVDGMLAVLQTTKRKLEERP